MKSRSHVRFGLSFALALLGAAAAFAPAGEPRQATATQKQVELRLLGGDKKEPLADVEVEATSGYGEAQKKFGPFRTNIEGTVKVRLPPGFYTLHLKSETEWPYLRVEEIWNNERRGHAPFLNLLVTDSGAEKWLEGERREAGYEPPATPGDAPR